MADGEDLHGFVFGAIKDAVNAASFTVEELADSLRSKR